MAFTISTRLFGCALLSVGLLSTAMSAHAGFRITAYSQTLGFHEIADNDYEEAQKRTIFRHKLMEHYTITANRCVAELMSGEVQKALESCSQAIELVPSSNSPIFSLRSRHAALATLLTNRGVVYAVLGMVAQAEADFLRAHELHHDFQLAMSNLRYLRALDDQYLVEAGGQLAALAP